MDDSRFDDNNQLRMSKESDEFNYNSSTLVIEPKSTSTLFDDKLKSLPKVEIK